MEATLTRSYLPFALPPAFLTAASYRLWKFFREEIPPVHWLGSVDIP